MADPPRSQQETTSQRRGQTLGARAGLLPCLLACLLAAASCASGPPTPRAAEAPNPLWSDAQLAQVEQLASALALAEPPAEGAIRIRLAFFEGVDLDLFVSDPLEETVYFANDRAKSGGKLIQDRRCGMTAPHIEVVEYEAPRPGRYRIGLDYPRSCGESRIPSAVFAIAVERGESREIHRGIVGLGIFLPEVARFDHRPEAP